MKTYIRCIYGKTIDDINDYVFKVHESFPDSIMTYILQPTNDLGLNYTDKGLNNLSTLIDDGNGLSITLEKRKIKLDYSEFERVMLLGHIYMNKAKHSKFTLKILKEESL